MCTASTCKAQTTARTAACPTIPLPEHSILLTTTNYISTPFRNIPSENELTYFVNTSYLFTLGHTRLYSTGNPIYTTQHTSQHDDVSELQGRRNESGNLPQTKSSKPNIEHDTQPHCSQQRMSSHTNNILKTKTKHLSLCGFGLSPAHFAHFVIHETHFPNITGSVPVLSVYIHHTHTS